MTSAIVTLLATTNILTRDIQSDLVRQAQNSNDNKALDALIGKEVPRNRVVLGTLVRGGRRVGAAVSDHRK